MSIFALMISAVAAKLRSELADVEITKLKAQIDDLDRQLTDVKRDLATMRIECDRWRALVERYQGRAEQPQRIAEEQTRQLMGMAQAQQAQYSQHNIANQVQQNQVLGSGLSQMIEQHFCNCVPARHDMFLPSGQRLI
jgi:septal ring factor EnvC (AmiA/AmiB activator)